MQLSPPNLDTVRQTPPAAQARLVGDIGGTHARFGIADGAGAVGAILVLPCSAFDGPAGAIRHYLGQLSVPCPRTAAFGIANPVTGDDVAMTNHPWRFSADALRRSLGLERLLLLNDFTALALSLPLLRPEERHPVGGGSALDGHAIGLIGPGTGLGVSGLVAAGGDHVPLQSEGGHVTLAARDHREAALIDWFRRHHGHVSAERVLSGPGLASLHDAVRALAGQRAMPLPGAEVSARAMSGACPYCAEALHHFCAMLGTVTADLALTLGARGGVYLGGGIIPQLGGFFARSAFRRRFEDKGRFSGYLASIPTFVIATPYAALRGAAAALANPIRVGHEAAEGAQ
ncbi:glucokinase [Thauera linaloolentis]|uniref:Glucokinase n=1 Tax=Thauera linaloolentis (strain DSM 12138 / JCM 21573 / CCUG 41526 / CIP 105981 / IAM 15112 / NBRC 102519 / 47Lol) TaxID=1123367 RepID=N6YQ40_THAL4|nr:glucokinase [Thauera linaloolentis]ENO84502.1 glucokinase [Thauera linaloolentis 47Lol = DSM 12138]MCM8566701.1 glucokinase [Thauera linaloolentis]